MLTERPRSPVPWPRFESVRGGAEGAEIIRGGIGCSQLQRFDVQRLSTRTVTDLENRRVYLPHPELGQHDSRTLALQALGHVDWGTGCRPITGHF